MDHIKAIGRRIKDGVVSVAPYIGRAVRAVAPYALTNIGAAVVADSGIDAVNDVVSLPKAFENGLFYISLGLFNVGVVYPVATEGVENFYRKLIGRNIDGYVRNRARAIGLVGLSVLMVASGREFFHEDSISVPQEDTSIVQKSVDSSSEGDVELEDRIQNYVNRLRSNGLARSWGVENFAIYMKDLTDDNVFVEMNADHQQMGASTLKLVVLAAGFEKISVDKLNYGKVVKRDMEKMICRSDNNATNRLISKIGLDYINDFIKKQGLDETIVELIPKNGRTLDNRTSARDLGDLLESIYEGRLNGSDEMKRILALDCKGHNDRLVDKTCIPIKKSSLDIKGGFVDEVYGKTGTTYGVNANAGVVEAKFLGENGAHPYVAVIMIEDKNAKADKFKGGYFFWGRSKSVTLRSIAEAGYWYLHDKHSELNGYKCKEHNGVHPK